MRLYRVNRLDATTVVVTEEVAGRLNVETGAFDWLDDLHQGEYLTRDVLATVPGGKAALAAWDSGDDSVTEAADKAWWLRVADEEDRALIRRRDLRAV